MINDLDTFDEQRMSASAVINALEPSENWDDDFEFQQGSSQANSPVKRKPNLVPRVDHDEHVFSTRMSIASSHFTEDWDAEGSLGAPSSPSRKDRSHKSGASKSSIPPALAQWIEEDNDYDHEPTMSTPSRRLFADVTMTTTNVPKTENWDDDFEDRDSPTRGSLMSRMAAITTKPSWDEEFGLGPPPRRKQTPRKRSSTKPVYSDSSSDGEEFGVIEEEDRTVTARSRRAVARPPVPALPSPFHASPPAIPLTSTFPIARSPTSSVFSVPNADTRSYTSTTHLRPSSAHGHSLSHLPPSPPIHKSRERRRLRKKSRPAPVNGGVYEMNVINRGGNNYPYAHTYQSFSDGQLAEIRDEDEHQPRTPSPHPPAPVAQPMSIAATPPRPRAASPMAPVPPTPSSGGRAGALLSRIGSVTKKGWGVRRKRGSSVSIPPNDPEPATDGAPSRPSLHQPRPLDYQQQSSIPRPRSSRSSLHHTNSRPSSNGHSPHPLSPGDQPAPPTSSSWFFRSASNTSGDSHGHGQPLAGYRDTCSTRSGSMSDLSVREVGGGSGSGAAPMTPSKLIKRKSLGFVQLRRGFGGHNNGQNEVVEFASEPGGSGTPSKRPVSMAIGVGEPGGGRTARLGSQPRHASYGASSGARERKRSAVLSEAMGGSQHGRRVDTTTETETDCDPEVERERAAERGKEKERSGGSLASGMRAFMGNVRRLSIVGGRSGESSGSNTPGHGKSPNGKHKRTKSGTAMPIKTVVDSVAGKGSRSGTPTSQHGRPLTPSTSYPHLASAVGLSGMAKVETRKRSGSRSEFRSDSRAESRPGSRSGLMRAGSGRATSPPQVVSSAMSSRQVSAASSASAETSGSGSVSSVPMPVSILSSGRRRSGSASSTNTNRRSSTTLEDNQKTPRASKIQHYPPKTPDKPPPMPLLPPIELHPPSPPKVLDQNGDDPAARYQSLGMDGSTGASPLDSSASPPFSPISVSSTNNPLLGLSPSSSRSLSPIASLASPSASPKTIKEPGNIGHSPKPPFTGSSPGGGTAPGKLAVRPPISPGQLQSASLGRSTAGSIVAGTAVAGASSGSSSSVGEVGGGATAVPRRNSLGDLKIPARISQAQSSLRRDLGMVREFAGHVEHMKSLQTTYDELVTEVQGLLERHAAGWYAQQQQQLAQQVRTAQPNFFNNLVGTARSSAMKVRRRSYTNPEGKNTSSDAQSSTTSVNQAHSQVSAAAAKAAYKNLATAFYTINSKYRISWECAELLVELGSGSGGGGGTTSATTSPSRPGTAGLGIGQSLAASASTTAIHPPHELNGVKGKKSRERAITLAGDESRPSTPSGIMLPSPPRPSLELLHAASQPHSPHAQGSQSPHPPLASPPSWRASTGRNDLSQRQLALLKEMLNNPDLTVASSPPAYGGAIPEESPLSPSPHTPLSSPLAGYPSSSNLHVNRDWRWGNDPMSSTITLPSEEEGLASGDNQRGADGGAKKKRGRLNMSGFRDMLKALRKGGGVIDTSVVIGHTQAGSGVAYGASTASLSMESSADGHSVMQHHQHSSADRYGHARVGRSSNQQGQGQRKVDTSRGPSGTVGGGSTLDLSSDASHSPQTYSRAKLPPKSPRRPSLASIFRIGIGKNKSGSTVPASDGMPGSVPSSMASSRVPSGNSTSDEVAGGEDGGDEQGEEEEEEEDWDQIDSASDLDGHYGSGAPHKPYGGLSPTGLEGSGTIRAVSTSRGKKLRKPNSPYLQQDPYAARSTSGFSVKRNASGSQLSLNLSSDSSSANVPAASPASAGAGGAVPKHMTALMTPRPIRLSNVQENQAESPVWPMRSLAHGHPSQLSSSPSGISPSSRSVSGSSGKFHTVGPLAGANVSSKTGSVRSMPPQPISMPRPSPSRPHSEGQTAAPPALALTPENIRPLLENAREVQTRLNNCIAEVQALLERAKGVPVPAVPLANESLSRLSVAAGGQS